METICTYSDGSTVRYNITGTMKSDDITTTDLVSCELGSTVTSLSIDTFKWCKTLTSITFNNITTIGEKALWGCTSLEKIYIPASVTSIANNAFMYATNIETITVDEDNPVYDSRNNCNAIIETASNTLVVGGDNTIIPDSVTTIGTNAFCRCNGFGDNGEIIIPSSVTSILTNAFESTGIRKVTIPDSVTTIQNHAFSTADYLSSITVGNGVSVIPMSCFSCAIPKKARTVVLGTGITSIERLAFTLNTLTAFTIKAVTPPTLSSEAFASANFNSGFKVYVPSASVDAYKAANVWSKFASIIEAIAE